MKHVTFANWTKWCLGVLLSPFVLFIILTLFIYCPPVQRWAVGKATQYASEKTGMQIGIHDVCLKFPLDLKLNGVSAVQRNDSVPQQRDTLLIAESVICDVQLIPLFCGKVEVDILQLDGVGLNTTNMISDCRVKGRVGQMIVTSHGINLKKDSVRVNMARVTDANLDICLSDTAKKDTTESEPVSWILALDDILVKRSKFLVHMPGDTLNIAADIASLGVKQALIDLPNSAYKVHSIDLSNSSLRYDNLYEPKIKGLDYNHLSLSNINIGADSLVYRGTDLGIKIRACNMKEKSGLEVSSLTCSVAMDSTRLHVNGLDLRTPYSNVMGELTMDFNAFDSENPGRIIADINAALGKKDIMIVSGDMLPNELKRQWPSDPVSMKLRADGNMKKCQLTDVSINIPTLLSCEADGTLYNLDNADSMVADVRFNAMASGKNGAISGNAHYDASDISYTALLQVNGFNLNRFVPGYGLGVFSGKIDAKGRGIDIYSPLTKLDADIEVGQLKYQRWNFAGTRLQCRVSNGQAHANIHSVADILRADATLDALLRKKKISATIGADIRNIDLYALRLTKAPLSTGVCCHLDIDTDLGDNILLNGNISDIRIADSTQVFHPDDIDLDVRTTPDTTHAVVNCGDFSLRADASGGYRYLMKFGDVITKEVNRQMDGRIIDEMALRSKLPKASLYLSTGMENPVSRLLSRLGYEFSRVYANVTASPVDGLNGLVQIDTLKTSSLQLDDIRLDVSSDQDNTMYKLKVVNGKDNPQYSFSALLTGELMANGSAASLIIDDKDGKRGIDIGLAAVMEPEGIRVTIDERKQILGYRGFTPNPGNYLVLGKGMRLSADLMLKADDGTGVQVYTNDDNTDALQDVTLSLHNLDIAGILSVVPYTPNVTGVMNGDFHAIITDDETSISCDVRTRKLCYEGCSMGDISTEIVYMPQDDGSHHVDGILYKDNKEVANIVGTYYFRDEDYIDADIDLKDLPMNLVNGFVPDQIIGMDGYGNGCLKIKGKVSEPKVDGTLDLGNAMFVSVPYGVKMAIDKDPVRIVSSSVVFDNFRFFDTNHQPMVMNGYCDFSELENIMVNLSIKGENILLIDAKENRRSEAYGKAYVNFYSIINGYVDRLKVKAHLDVLPSTNLYYILRDSPITTDNRLKELVEFTDFSLNDDQPKVLPTVDGMTVDFSISVRSGSHITCWLNTNHSNYLDIMGSGDLRLKMENDEMSMTGRYTIANGEMKYSLPVIPLKTFTISEDSYIEFFGDIMNPRLNITAVERNRATVSENGENRTVDFNCGVVITKTLQDMGLQFIIDAPEDPVTADALNTMSVEDRGKIAVTMLTTGMYLTDSNTSSITMNSALSSFLQQEINNIAGSALKTLDLTMGLENTMHADGTMSMDYSFKFAKRFWNNRLSVSIGGRISTGTQAAGKTPSFFDNVEVQYRLSDTSNQYVRLFYKHDVYDYLEGYLDHYGVGYMWKRKLQNFKDIFRFRGSEMSLPRRSSSPQPSEKRDTVSAVNISLINDHSSYPAGQPSHSVSMGSFSSDSLPSPNGR